VHAISSGLGQAFAAVEGFAAAVTSTGAVADGRYVTCEKGLPRVKIYMCQRVSNRSSPARNHLSRTAACAGKRGSPA